MAVKIQNMENSFQSVQTQFNAQFFFFFVTSANRPKKRKQSNSK